MRPLLFLLSASLLLATVAPQVSPDEIDRYIQDAIGSPPAGNLAAYAAATGRASDRYESAAEAARRILAGTRPTKQAVDQTLVVLEQLASCSTPSTDTELAALRARFHAHRLRAAVHYNLFLRGLRLAELVAATYAEKEAVVIWRRMVGIATLARHPSALALRADLTKYEASLKDLEEQCCPPDEAVLKEKIWQPGGSL